MSSVAGDPTLIVRGAARERLQKCLVCMGEFWKIILLLLQAGVLGAMGIMAYYIEYVANSALALHREEHADSVDIVSPMRCCLPLMALCTCRDLNIKKLDCLSDKSLLCCLTYVV